MGALLLLLSHAPVAKANVYATNIRLNGGTTNVAAPLGGTNVTISYLLNEPASSGITVTIKNGDTVVWTTNRAGGTIGTDMGLNTLVWNGKDNSTNKVPGGSYTVSITAATTGYGDWTQISDEFDPSKYYYVARPRGIAVNRNSNSPYYGRIFVANGAPGPNPGIIPGDTLGFQKMNADGSPAAEGVFSSGGWGWSGNSFSPWKIEISDDDYAYVNDLTTNGLVLRFDQALSTNSRTLVLRSDNWPSGSARLSGPFITGSGTNTQIWMADTNTSGSTGIRRWAVSGDGTVATNDTGATIVQAGGGSDLSISPYDVAIDRSNRVYTIQSLTGSGDPAYRVMRFTGTNASVTTAEWKIGASDNNMRGASGIAINSAETRVAVAFTGAGTGLSRVGGAVRVFNPTNGVSVATLTLGGNHDHTDAAWDNVGNLYTCDNWDSVFRVYSPPGSNGATTVSIAIVQVASPNPPVLSNPFYSSGQFQFTLTGQSNVIYVVQSSTNLQNWVSESTNSQLPAIRTIILTAPDDRRFYRAYAQ